jgi:hypothetical protein
MSTIPVPLPMSDIVTVNVSVASGAVAARQFNQGLIIGSSPVIPSYGANRQLRQYASLAAMLSDGFTSTDPEYLAAQLYFGQETPPQFVWIGRQDLTAIQTAIPHSGAAGTGYVVGDQITVVQSGASFGVLEVLTISSGGVVTSLGTTVGNQGTGYSIAAGLSTTGGSGTGLEVDITAIGETILQAAQYCSQLNQNWYGYMGCGATDSDHLANAAYSNAEWETLLYFGSTSDAAVAAGTAGNIALQLQALKYKALLSYNTTQGGEYPNNIYAAAALLGLYCGLDTGAPASYFTLNLKTLAGIAPEQLSQTQWDAIVGANCNTCVTFGPYSGYVNPGILSSGDYFDEILFRATLVNLIQINLMNLLVSTPSIPQTDAGEHQLISQVEEACNSMVLIGYIGPGVWSGAAIQNLQTGQSLPLGYIVQAPSYATQSSAARAARQAMPITAAIIEAGAVQSVVVNVNVQL